MIRIYFKTTPITIKFLEQCILPRIKLISKCVFVVNINFVRHQTTTVDLLLIPQQTAPLISNVANTIKLETKLADAPFNPNPEFRNLRPNLFWTEKNQTLEQ